MALTANNVTSAVLLLCAIMGAFKAEEAIMSLRERKKLEIRREISQFGINLFLKNGFTNTTVDEIVDPLGISKRTFFRYFETKEDVVFAWYEELTTELVDALKARPTDEEPFDAVCETLFSLLKYYDPDQNRARAMMRLSRETPALVGKSFEKKAIWERELSQALSRRLGKPARNHLKARVIVGSAMTAFTSGVDEWYEKQGKTELRPLLQKAFSFIRFP
jgi:AcrR family transcriptional regulator